MKPYLVELNGNKMINYRSAADGTELGVVPPSLLQEPPEALIAQEITEQIEAPVVETDGEGNTVFETKMVDVFDEQGNLVGQTEEQVAVFQKDGNGDLIMQTLDIVVGTEIVLDGALKAQAVADAIDEADRQVVEERVSVRKDRGDFCRNLQARIADMNDQKPWSDAEYQTYYSDPVITQMFNLLLLNAVKDLKALIQASDLSAYYTADELTLIVALIDGQIALEGI